jgi:hypothetical protein
MTGYNIMISQNPNVIEKLINPMLLLKPGAGLQFQIQIHRGDARDVPLNFHGPA